MKFVKVIWRSTSLAHGCLITILLLLSGTAVSRARLVPEHFQDPARQPKGGAQLLELSQPVEREIAAGQSHAYRINIGADQYLNVVVDQRGIDLVVLLFAPDGRKISEVDSPNGSFGPETMVAITRLS